jgi:BirA family transcriptional regulator, biotin operon repressor / biotin---[acetyl-CoA-carboxylase] ligase
MSNTLFVGKVYHRFDELPSTNDWAAKLVAQMEDSSSNSGPESAAKTKPPEGTVVRAANQTAGRGQLGSRWHSAPEENLLLSVIFYPTWLEAQAQFYLSMAVALGVHDFIGSLGHLSLGHLSLGHLSLGHLSLGHSSLGHLSLGHLSLGHSSLGHLSLGHSIKWPNDLYLGNKKTAGILIQNALSGSRLQSSIVGIGLNVNQLNFPSDLPNATSLALAFGQNLDLDMVADRLFECLERRYLQLKSGNRTAIKSEYEANLWRRSEHSRFVRSSDDQEFEGKILGVTELGLLQMETESGIAEFEVKQLRFVL